MLFLPRLYPLTIYLVCILVSSLICFTAADLKMAIERDAAEAPANAANAAAFRGLIEHDIIHAQPSGHETSSTPDNGGAVPHASTPLRQEGGGNGRIMGGKDYLKTWAAAAAEESRTSGDSGQVAARGEAEEAPYFETATPSAFSIDDADGQGFAALDLPLWAAPLLLLPLPRGQLRGSWSGEFLPDAVAEMARAVLRSAAPDAYDEGCYLPPGAILLTATTQSTFDLLVVQRRAMAAGRVRECLEARFVTVCLDARWCATEHDCSILFVL